MEVRAIRIIDNRVELEVFVKNCYMEIEIQDQDIKIRHNALSIDDIEYAKIAEQHVRSLINLK